MERGLRKRHVRPPHLPLRLCNASTPSPLPPLCCRYDAADSITPFGAAVLKKHVFNKGGDDSEDDEVPTAPPSPGSPLRLPYVCLSLCGQHVDLRIRSQPG